MKTSFDEKSDNEIIVKFDEKKDFKLAKALEKVLSYFTTSSTKSAFHVQLPVETNHQDKDQEQSICETCSQRMKNNDERFENFNNEKIFSMFHEVFVTEQHFGQRIHKHNLSESSKIIQDLKNHSYRAEFMKTQRNHLESHHQLQSFYELDQKHAKSQQVLHCMWIFVYKTDKHEFLQKYKIRLVVCENQQTLE